MYVKIDNLGVLTIYAENDLESYALGMWNDEFEKDECSIMFNIDRTGYNKSIRHEGIEKSKKEKYNA